MIELRRRYGAVSGGGQPSRLPAGYQEVEYIQNTGDSYIVLDFKFADIKFKFVVTPDDFIPSMQMGYGSTLMVGFLKESGVAAITPVINGRALSISIPSSETTIHTIEIRHSDNTLIIDDVNAANDARFNNNSNFGVFCRAEHSASKMKGKMYVLQRNYGEGYIDQYIPCRRLSDNEKGMYDIVNDVFYVNQGTGEFLVGADVGGSNTDIEYLTAIEVTGGSITTDWIPQAGAIVKWDCMALSSSTGVIADQRYFDTVPDTDDAGRVFDSNNNGREGHSVNVWIDYKLGHGATSPWDAPNMLLSKRHTYIWDGLNGQAGYDGRMTKLGNKRTTSSGYPLRLFCGRTSSRIIIYGIELINQESEGGQTYTLRPARKNGIIGLYSEETGVLLSSDNGVEFTIYEE